MTAEIAILNKMAVALAADSKVTVRRGTNKEKTYDTVNKLFTLSKHSPVGIMIYGNAEFMNVPWETIIKMYRSKLGKKRFDIIPEYCQDFFRFVSREFKPAPEIELNYVRKITASFCEEIYTSAFTKLWADKTDKKSLEDFIDQESKDYLTKLDGTDFLRSRPHNRSLLYTVSDRRKISSKYRRTISEVIGTCFPDKLAAQVRNRLIRCVLLLIFKDAFSDMMSGVVIAGFGDKEIFPSLVAFNVEGIIGGKLKKKEMKNIDIGTKTGGAIIPFAQQEMVYRFMEGIDPHYRQYLESKIRSLSVQNAISILEVLSGKKKVTQKTQDAVIKNVDKNIKELISDSRAYRKEKYAKPIIETMVLLPKEELANMAESLVNLTSLKRRVSADAETVGGPIDVAVISKGDGFVWIKRKHYFSRDLNPFFVQTYLDA